MFHWQSSFFTNILSALPVNKRKKFKLKMDLQNCNSTPYDTKVKGLGSHAPFMDFDNRVLSRILEPKQKKA